jgi:hypothetical protein
MMIYRIYRIYDDKEEIMLWSYAASTSKRPHSQNDPEEGSSAHKRSRYNELIDKLQEVDA